MSRAEAAIRRAGPLMALAAASALMGFPAGAEHAMLLALHALFLLGCAAVQLAPAHRAVAGLARRAAEATRGKGVFIAIASATVPHPSPRCISSGGVIYSDEFGPDSPSTISLCC
ncbi:unnamed protein product [Urochloa humidicola]